MLSLIHQLTHSIDDPLRVCPASFGKTFFFSFFLFFGSLNEVVRRLRLEVLKQNSKTSHITFERFDKGSRRSHFDLLCSLHETEGNVRR